MHGGALTLARRQLSDEGPRPDVVLAGDMLDLAAFLALSRSRLADVPAALYMHENQLAYPEPPAEDAWSDSRRRRAKRVDEHYGFTNLSSCLAADAVWWNSAFNRDSFLTALPGFLGQFPDFREPGAPDAVAARSSVLPLGIDLRVLDAARPKARPPGPVRIVWNHRWEHDKGPEVFFRAMHALAARDLDFELIILGEQFVREPAVFAAAREALGPRIVQWGYAQSRGDYARWLWRGDVVVSTARHEFFGAALCEAIYCGCMPVAPWRLSYPEILPDALLEACLVRDESSLHERLASLLSAPDTRLDWSLDPTRVALRDAVASYDWAMMAPRYDDALRALVERGPRSGPLYGDALADAGT